MIHHTAVSYQRNKNQWKATNNYHKSLWNFRSSLGFYAGYNYEIAKNGLVNQARADGETTAACYQKSMNDGRCIHIVLDGHFDIEKPYPNQIYALRDLIRVLVMEHKILKSNIVFHREYANKSCPGINMDLEFIRSLTKKEAKPEKIKPIKTKESIKQRIVELIKQIIELINKL